eukprot:3852321-Pleurochrysis_carterae.AAC.1
MRAGPARRSFEQCLRSDSASSVHMLVVRVRRKRFREDVRHVVVRPNLVLSCAPRCFRAPRTLAPSGHVGQHVASVGKSAVLSRVPRPLSCPRTSGWRVPPRAPSLRAGHG